MKDQGCKGARVQGGKGNDGGTEREPVGASAVDEQELVSAQKTSAEVFPGKEDLPGVHRSSGDGRRQSEVGTAVGRSADGSRDGRSGAGSRDERRRGGRVTTGEGGRSRTRTIICTVDTRPPAPFYY